MARALIETRAGMDRTPPSACVVPRLRARGCLNPKVALHLPAMQPLKAHVRKGRLVLDEPTDLPDGEVIELVPVNEIFAGGVDDLDDEERERLHESLRESVRQMKDGETLDAAAAMAELRAHR